MKRVALAACLAASFSCDSVLEPVGARVLGGASGGGGAGGAGLAAPVRKPLPSDLGDDVRAQYGARGDGTSDDTAALKRALADGRTTPDNDYYTGRPKALLFPAGTYLVSDTLSWVGCCVHLQGEGAGVTVIRLAPGSPGFNDPAHPRPVLTMPNGNTSRRQAIRDLTVEIGADNPGAIGIEFSANDSGTVRDVEIHAQDGEGVTGLSLVRDWPGPCLIKNVTITGFATGIAIAGREYGVVLENIVLEGQGQVGLRNDGNVVSINHLASTNTVTAVANRGTMGALTLLDARLEGGAADAVAIVNEGGLVVRRLETAGYRAALTTGGRDVAGPRVDEVRSGAAVTLFPAGAAPVAIAPEESPEYDERDLARWIAFAPAYGDQSQLKPTLEAGKPVVYFPGRVYLIGGTAFTVPPTLRKLMALGSGINSYDAFGLTLTVEDDGAEPLILDGFGYGVTIEHKGRRTVVLRHGHYGYRASTGAGKVFFEDVESGPLVFVPGQEVFARQLNGGGDVHITNQGARVWLFGYEREGVGTAVRTLAGGQTELLGGLLYPATTFPADAAPAFDILDADASLSWRISTYIDNGIYPVEVREVRGTTTKLLRNGDLGGWFVPHYVARR